MAFFDMEFMDESGVKTGFSVLVEDNSSSIYMTTPPKNGGDIYLNTASDGTASLVLIADNTASIRFDFDKSKQPFIQLCGNKEEQVTIGLKDLLKMKELIEPAGSDQSEKADASSSD